MTQNYKLMLVAVILSLAFVPWNGVSYAGLGECGNEICDLGEDCELCPDDCISGTTSGAVCGNGICEAGDGEDCYSCAADCNGKTNGRPANRFCCGFDANESTPYSPDGCGSGSECVSGENTCTTIPVGDGDSTCCGDLICEGAEDSCNCALDCGPAPGTEIATVTCDDSFDNDCDGFIDCDDQPDCDADPACSGDTKECDGDGAVPVCHNKNKNKTIIICVGPEDGPGALDEHLDQHGDNIVGDEVCDGIDNDCDGVDDDGFPLGDPCTVGFGDCEASGNLICTGDGTGTECDATAGTPDCSGLECGGDGCGGSCGTCAPGEICDAGQCECQPDCSGLVCGGDGCGGSCGTCASGNTCNAGQCVCQPDCGAQQCGNDGCGGSCGECNFDESCDENGQCVCDCENQNFAGGDCCGFN